MPSTRIVVLCIAAGFAATAALAAPTGPMGFDDARHLLARTGFGPTEAEVRTYATLSREEGVAALLRDTRTAAVTAPPAWTLEAGPLRAPRGDTATEDERRVFRQSQIRQGLELRGWWLQEMLVTPSPLTERMTLFWHNHFVSSQQKVRFARLMYAQNVTLRAHAVGNFGALLHAASKDPAMLVYLDAAQSRKGQPNENFAREVMELFTLGEGQYTEQDIKEAARAFTGWSIDRDTGTYMFRPALHDYGVKTVLGRAGRFNGDAVLDVILAQPQTARFVIAKLWREFVSTEPDPREVQRIALILRGQDYDLKAALRALLASDAFWAADNRGTLFKSPVELVVGTLRQLEVMPGSGVAFAVTAAGMGQNLFAPPNVKGWPGGDSWINSNTLLARKQFLDRLARMDTAPAATMPTAAISIAAQDEAGAMDSTAAAASSKGLTPSPSGATAQPMNRVAAPAATAAADDDKARALRFARQVDRSVRSVRFDATEWVDRRDGASGPAKQRAAQSLLLPLPPVTAETPATGVDALAFVRATLLDPAYQLK